VLSRMARVERPVALKNDQTPDQLRTAFAAVW
jgi:hypothetical protein